MKASSTSTAIVNPSPTFASVPLGPWDVGSVVNVDMKPALSGGTPPFVWSATGLPPGLAIDPVIGIVSGTVQGPGDTNYTITITADDGR
jgi:hypothetical protein